MSSLTVFYFGLNNIEGDLIVRLTFNIVEESFNPLVSILLFRFYYVFLYSRESPTKSVFMTIICLHYPGLKILDLLLILCYWM